MLVVLQQLQQTWAEAVGQQGLLGLAAVYPSWLLLGLLLAFLACYSRLHMQHAVAPRAAPWPPAGCKTLSALLTVAGRTRQCPAHNCCAHGPQLHSSSSTSTRHGILVPTCLSLEMLVAQGQRQDAQQLPAGADHRRPLHARRRSEVCQQQCRLSWLVPSFSLVLQANGHDLMSGNCTEI